MITTDYFYPHIGGGVEKVVLELSKNFIKNNDEVHIVTFNTTNSKKFEIYEGIKIHRINTINLTKFIGAQISMSPSAIYKIYQLIKEINPDIINIHNRFYFTTLCTILLKRFIHKPIIITLHLGEMKFGNFFLRTLINLYEKTIVRYILKNSDHVIAVSDGVKNHIFTLSKSLDITVIPNGVDLDEFKAKPIDKLDSDLCMVTFIGRLIQNKGIQYVIQAAPSIITSNNNIRFQIVGEGPLKEKMLKLVDELNLTDYFSFLGWVPSVREILHQTDIFIRPSITEGMPLTILEAMASQLPVIASNVAGVPELINDFNTGLLIDVGDINSLSEKIILLSMDPTLRYYIGKNARKYVENNYNWELTSRNNLDLFKKILCEYVIVK